MGKRRRTRHASDSGIPPAKTARQLHLGELPAWAKAVGEPANLDTFDKSAMCQGPGDLTDSSSPLSQPCFKADANNSTLPNAENFVGKPTNEYLFSVVAQFCMAVGDTVGFVCKHLDVISKQLGEVYQALCRERRAEGDPPGTLSTQKGNPYEPAPLKSTCCLVLSQLVLEIGPACYQNNWSNKYKIRRAISELLGLNITTVDLKTVHFLPFFQGSTRVLLKFNSGRIPRMLLKRKQLLYSHNIIPRRIFQDTIIKPLLPGRACEQGKVASLPSPLAKDCPPQSSLPPCGHDCGRGVADALFDSCCYSQGKDAINLLENCLHKLKSVFSIFPPSCKDNNFSTVTRTNADDGDESPPFQPDLASKFVHGSCTFSRSISPPMDVVTSIEEVGECLTKDQPSHPINANRMDENSDEATIPLEALLTTTDTDDEIIKGAVTEAMQLSFHDQQKVVKALEKARDQILKKITQDMTSGQQPPKGHQLDATVNFPTLFPECVVTRSTHGGAFTLVDAQAQSVPPRVFEYTNSKEIPQERIVALAGPRDPLTSSNQSALGKSSAKNGCVLLDSNALHLEKIDSPAPPAGLSSKLTKKLEEGDRFTQVTTNITQVAQ